MIKNYFKTAWRNLLKNKVYSAINVAGLTFGLAVGMLVLLWVQDELSFDAFHKNAESIYRLETVGGLGESRRTFSVAMAPIAVYAQKELPEIKNAVRIARGFSGTAFHYGEKVFVEDNTAFADPSLFSVFDFPLLESRSKNPFPDVYSVVLTKTTARKYFGSADAIGKVLTLRKGLSVTVTGVVADFPQNSTISYSMILPLALLNRIQYQEREVSYRGAPRTTSMDEDWHVLGYETYLQLRPDSRIGPLQTKLRDIHIRNKSDDTDVAYLLEPLRDQHLYKSDGSDGGIQTVRIFAIIGILILMIACINYVNLSTAISMMRAKEVSVRKIIGADRGQLFAQFMVETTVLFLVSSVLAIGLIAALMPVYNNFSGKQLVFTLSDPGVWAWMGGILLLTLAASSFYPAILLSSFEPLKALKGKVNARIGALSFRRVLVVTQFAVSVMLITGTIVISKQLNYIQHKDLGYDKSRVFTFNMGNLSPHYESVRSRLLQSPGVADVTRGGGSLVDVSSFTGDVEWQGMPPKTNLYFHPLAVDKNLIPFFRIKLSAGSNFSGSSADSVHFIVNEEAVRAMNLERPIGKRFRLGKVSGTIIGVVRDFHFASMRKKIEPAVFTYGPQNSGTLFVKTRTAGTPAALAAAERIWSEQNNTPFSYSFLDETFNRLYASEQRTGALFNVFAGVAIFISCLGLFGLATFTAQVKTREIGIRKVLGASVLGIVQLLAREFVLLVVLAIIIAVPISWYAMTQWLQDFAYKTELSAWVFLVAAAGAIVIALVTVSVQSIKAALLNPVKSLRTE